MQMLTEELAFEHVTKQLLHRCCTNCLLKVNLLDVSGRNIFQGWHCQKKPKCLESLTITAKFYVSDLANLVPCLSLDSEESEDWLLTWCWSIDKLWSWRFSTSFLSLSPVTSGLNRTIAFKQANSAGSIESSLKMSMKESRIVKDDARDGEMSVNWDLEKMVAEWRGRHHWIEQSKNNSDQLSSNSRAYHFVVKYPFKWR